MARTSFVLVMLALTGCVNAPEYQAALAYEGQALRAVDATLKARVADYHEALTAAYESELQSVLKYELAMLDNGGMVRTEDVNRLIAALETQRAAIKARTEEVKARYENDVNLQDALRVNAAAQRLAGAESSNLANLQALMEMTGVNR